jgi:succinoglycan biosynthesis protein ExoA
VTAWPIITLVAAYALALIAMTAAIARSSRPRFATLWRVPLVIGASHFGYGVGSIVGWIDVARGARGRARYSTLTR